jgi:membrane protein implicated in regulation of membrane protease activity
VEIAGLVLAALSIVIAVPAGIGQLLSWLHKRWLERQKLESDRQKLESDRQKLEEILARLAEDREKPRDNGDHEG